MMFGRFEIPKRTLEIGNLCHLPKALDSSEPDCSAENAESGAPLAVRQRPCSALDCEGEHTRELASQNIAALRGPAKSRGGSLRLHGVRTGGRQYCHHAGAQGSGFRFGICLDMFRARYALPLAPRTRWGWRMSSLEPAKIMVAVGPAVVKVLGYGISTMGLIQAETGNGFGAADARIARRNRFAERRFDQPLESIHVGAILYEMVTAGKAFGAERSGRFAGSRSENEMPELAPGRIASKGASWRECGDMKALAKDPAARYQNGRRLDGGSGRIIKRAGREEDGHARTKKKLVNKRCNSTLRSDAAASAKFHHGKLCE